MHKLKAYNLFRSEAFHVIKVELLSYFLIYDLMQYTAIYMKNSSIGNLSERRELCRNKQVLFLLLFWHRGFIVV